MAAMLEVETLKKYFRVGGDRKLHAVDDITFTEGAPAEPVSLTIPQLNADTYLCDLVRIDNVNIKTEEGKYVCEYTAGSSTTDAFGHIQMTGTASYLAQLVQSELGCKTRAIELSTLQRAAAHMASRVDVDEAFSVGGATIKAADEGSSGVMVVIDRVSDDPYQSTTHVFDVHRIANDEKVVPRKWINKAGNYVTEEFLDYVRPLIQGHYTPMMVEGLPRHLNVNMKDYDWVTDTKSKK